MATDDKEFIDRLRATFKVEAEEHLHAISSTLLELEKSPSAHVPKDAVESVYREAHSLKGAARAVDFSDIESICQAIEGVFAAWKKEMAVPAPESLDALHRALDMIHASLGSQSPAGASQLRDDLIRRLGQLQSDSSPISRQERAIPKVAFAPLPAPSLAPQPAHQPELATLPVETDKSAPAQTVRIPVSKLDARLLQAEEMLLVKGMAAQRASELREVTLRFNGWQREWARVSADTRTLRKALELRDTQAANEQSVAVAGTMVNFLDWNLEYVRSMESKLRLLTLQAEQDRHNIAKQVDEMLEESKKLLMLPFSTLSSAFPKLIRDLCRDQGKEADLVVQGGEVEIDKRILEEMKDALMHILRNCVDHGVEMPAQRELRHKPPRALITIAVSAVSGSNVEILVSDDGGGVNVPAVKESAVRHGILSAGDAGALSDSDALDLVFHSDVSTNPTVTAISGRGLGMAIVRGQTEKLGGHVSIESTPNAGTVLRMTLPMTMATFRGVLVSVAKRVFVIPTINVERVLRVNSQDIHTVENRRVISVHGRAVSLVGLDAVLEFPKQLSLDNDSKGVYVVLLHGGDQRIAFTVDQIIREEEVLVKALRKPLIRIRNIAGVTVLGSGKTVPILNVSDLMLSARTRGGAPIAGTVRSKPQEAPAKKVLVAEDSITSRMLLKGILEGAGFTVRTAIDGMDAFTALREENFDLVVSDVEMPRMNGFDLTARIRSDKRLTELPVVLVSALESREEKERGIDAGASAYLVKSSFDQSNLLEAVHRLV